MKKERNATTTAQRFVQSSKPAPQTQQPQSVQTVEPTTIACSMKTFSKIFKLTQKYEKIQQSGKEQQTLEPIYEQALTSMRNSKNQTYKPQQVQQSIPKQQRPKSSLVYQQQRSNTSTPKPKSVQFQDDYDQQMTPSTKFLIQKAFDEQMPLPTPTNQPGEFSTPTRVNFKPTLSQTVRKGHNRTQTMFVGGYPKPELLSISPERTQQPLKSSLRAVTPPPQSKTYERLNAYKQKSQIKLEQQRKMRQSLEVPKGQPKLVAKQPRQKSPPLYKRVDKVLSQHERHLNTKKQQLYWENEIKRKKQGLKTEDEILTQKKQKDQKVKDRISETGDTHQKRYSKLIQESKLKEMRRRLKEQELDKHCTFQPGVFDILQSAEVSDDTSQQHTPKVSAVTARHRPTSSLLTPDTQGLIGVPKTNRVEDRLIGFGQEREDRKKQHRRQNTSTFQPVVNTKSTELGQTRKQQVTTFEQRQGPQTKLNFSKSMFTKKLPLNSLKQMIKAK